MTWVAAGAAVVGTGMSMYGANQQKKAIGKGTAAEWEAMTSDTAFQRKLWEEEQARLAPRHETALEFGLPMMEQYRSEGGIDLSNMPLYQMQMDQGQQAMADAGIGDYGQRRFQENLGVAEQDASYARLQDMMQIGLGAAGSAGAGAQRFGTNAANSMMGAGNAIAQGQMQQGNIQNSMYSNALGTMGQLPAYYSNQQQRPTNIQGPVSPYQMAQGGIR